jgi:Flp pilus assembly protein TadG
MAMRRKSEGGQALILAALALVVLLASAGVAVDMGVARYEKRLQQSAADAAALAGASNLTYGGVTAGALDAAQRDGFADTATYCSASCPSSGSVGYVQVTVNPGPATGPHAGDPKYVEAIVTAVHQTYFMNIVKIFSDTVTARAVATDLSGGGPGSGCIYTLGPPSSSIEGVNINGSATLNAPTCGVVDNGNFNTKGNKLVVTTSTFGTSGNWLASGPGGTVTCSETPTSCPTPSMSAAPDPLARLTPPCSPCTGGGAISINGNGNFSGSGVTYSNGVYTISPGTYSSITITGVAANTVVFSSGIYIINGSSGGITIPGNATISSGPGGVMFYFTNGSTINSNGTPTIQLTAMTSGTYAGILMYQDPNDTNTTGPSLGGNNSSYYYGALYFPKDQLTFYGNNSSVAVGLVVADSLNLSGNPTVNVIGTAGLQQHGITVGALATTILVE